MKHTGGSEETASVSAPDTREAARAKTFPGLLHWPPFWLFTLLVLAASAIGYAAFQQHKTDTKREEMGVHRGAGCALGDQGTA